MFMNNQAYVLHIYEYVCTVGQWLHIHMSALAFLLFLINSIYGLILFYNLALGYMLENVILFYMYMHFYLMNFIPCFVRGYPLVWHHISPT